MYDTWDLYLNMWVSIGGSCSISVRASSIVSKSMGFIKSVSVHVVVWWIEITAGIKTVIPMYYWYTYGGMGIVDDIGMGLGICMCE